MVATYNFGSVYIEKTESLTCTSFSTDINASV